jgi:hypothetical protein
VHVLETWEKAAEFLSQNLGPGDLVLLRSKRDAHFARIYFAMLGAVKCHKVTCSYRIHCDECPELGFVPRSEVAAAAPVAVQVH